jgi:PTH1 family peptidyl-tRNA hydrolase
MADSIQLIVGLGNPGAEYADTRHNAGAWLVETLVENSHQTLRAENKFSGRVATIRFDEQDCRVLIPTTFMNLSGQAVKAIASFYRIAAENILVIHDELDLPVGTVRIKQGGGDGGHNGLRDITAQLNTNNYWRCRIGIGHPGHRDQVHDYVLSRPSKSDQQQIMTSIENALTVLPLFVAGEQQKAMQQLHTQQE